MKLVLRSVRLLLTEVHKQTLKSVKEKKDGSAGWTPRLS